MRIHANKLRRKIFIMQKVFAKDYNCEKNCIEQRRIIKIVQYKTSDMQQYEISNEWNIMIKAFKNLREFKYE